MKVSRPSSKCMHIALPVLVAELAGQMPSTWSTSLEQQKTTISVAGGLNVEELVAHYAVISSNLQRKYDISNGQVTPEMAMQQQRLFAQQGGYGYAPQMGQPGLPQQNSLAGNISIDEDDSFLQAAGQNLSNGGGSGGSDKSQDLAKKLSKVEGTNEELQEKVKELKTENEELKEKLEALKKQLEANEDGSASQSRSASQSNSKSLSASRSNSRSASASQSLSNGF